MELRERNYRSRLGTRRSTKERREFAEDERPESRGDRERFSITQNARQPRLDPFYTVRKYLPWVIAVAVAYWAVSTYLF